VVRGGMNAESLVMIVLVVLNDDGLKIQVFACVLIVYVLNIYARLLASRCDCGRCLPTCSLPSFILAS